MRLHLVLALLVTTFLTSCAVIDPHRLLTRRNLATPLPETPVPMQSTSWRRDALEFVWNTVNDRYYDPKFNGVDWVAVRARYEPLLVAAKTDDEYWELLDKMTGELKDSHTRVHPPKQVESERKGEAVGLGLSFRELEGALVVTSVHPQSDAFWAGVRQGMVIQTIDGQPALPYYRALALDARDSSTPWARMRGAQRKISFGDVGTSVQMRFLRDGEAQSGDVIDVTMKRRAFAAGGDFTHRVLPSGFGYIRFSNFVGDFGDRFVNELRNMRDTPGVIIDLRGNGGGSGGMASRLIAQFLKEDFRPATAQTRSGKPLTIFGFPLIKMEPTIKGSSAMAYTKPLVILTNEGSASASEMFTAALKDAKRATQIGERTCGCLLAYMGVADVPGGAQMAYSEVGYVNRDGSRVEANGLKPDIEVALTRQDLLLGRDRTLERAVAYLREQAGTTSAKGNS